MSFLRSGNNALNKLRQELMDEYKEPPMSPDKAELELVRQMSLLNDAFKNMAALKKRYGLGLLNSHFDYIKNHFEKYTTEKSRNEIDDYLKKVESVFTSYKTFDQTLSDLQEVQQYFDKPPNCDDQFFLRKYHAVRAEYKNVKNPNNEDELKNILHECAKYLLYVKEMIRHLDTPSTLQNTTRLSR